MLVPAVIGSCLRHAERRGRHRSQDFVACDVKASTWRSFDIDLRKIVGRPRHGSPPLKAGSHVGGSAEPCCLEIFRSNNRIEACSHDWAIARAKRFIRIVRAIALSNIQANV